ncbi:hypothetical protein BS78_02G099600 [Paspalum vaginatum]|nr:hypothetical protein BS78_02G099600 [Paspalum vaginatum]
MDDRAAKRRSTAAGLPEDVLVEILSRVPARSVSRSKCVAKAWRDLIDDPSNRKRLPLVQRTLHGFFFISWKIYGGAGSPSQHDVRFAGLPAVPAPLRIDPSLSFLTTKSPGFELSAPAPVDDLLGYVVCNPATKHWETVPTYGPPHSAYVRQGYNYLVFDPAVSSQFHLVQFGEEDGFPADGSSVVVLDDDDSPEEEDGGGGQHDYDEDDSFGTSVHVYSSETHRWSHIQIDWDRNESGWDGHDLERWRHRGLVPSKGSGCAILNGMLHFVISDRFDQIAAVDVQGATQRLIPLPTTEVWVNRSGGYVAQSQGRLHYINQDMFDAQLFHTVSFVELFGKKSRTHYKNEYNVVAMHPDANVIFIVRDWSLKMISYDIDRKLVSVVGTLQGDASIVHVVHYVPCFSKVPALTNKH